MRISFTIALLAGFLAFPVTDAAQDEEDTNLADLAAEILDDGCINPTAGGAVKQMSESEPEAYIVDILTAVLKICGECSDVQDAVGEAKEQAPDQEEDILEAAKASLDDPDSCSLSALASPMCGGMTNCSSDDLASPN